MNHPFNNISLISRCDLANIKNKSKKEKGIIEGGINSDSSTVRFSTLCGEHYKTESLKIIPLFMSLNKIYHSKKSLLCILRTILYPYVTVEFQTNE